MAYEAMNNAGVSKTKMVVILNDNDMSIARPAGAMGTYLAKIFSGKIYFSLRETIKMIISSFSKRFSAKAGKAEDLFRSAISGGTLFNALGFYYIGPIDGHDMDSLIPILKNVRDSKYQGPILIHIKTKKAKVIHTQKKQKTIIMVFQNSMLRLVSNTKLKVSCLHILKFFQIH
jgi:1-deoxy-D-xylulose-5-phosphate synthase